MHSQFGFLIQSICNTLFASNFIKYIFRFERLQYFSYPCRKRQNILVRFDIKMKFENQDNLSGKISLPSENSHVYSARSITWNSRKQRNYRIPRDRVPRYSLAYQAIAHNAELKSAETFSITENYVLYSKHSFKVILRSKKHF